jgi:predicted porin
MRFSAILLIVGGLTTATTASAMDGQLSIYGSIQPFVDNFKTSGATPEGLSPETGGATQVTMDDYSGDNLPARFRMTSGTSHIGFRGELELSEDFAAFIQIESQVGPDGDPYILASAWASRNSAAGLKGTYGTLFFGNWDTPYKYPLLFVGALRGLNPFDNVITANPGFNVPGTTTQNGRGSSRHDAAFNRRQGNSVQYWSPKFYGLSLRGALSLNEGRTREEFDPSINPILWSVLLSYDWGPLGVRYAYEQHLDYFGMDWVGGSPGGSFTNPTSKDDGHEIVAWYTFPTKTRLAAVLERLTYRTDDEVVGAVDGYQRDAVLGALQQRIGDHAIWGSFGVAGEGTCTVVGGGECTTNGLNGQQFSVGYTYSPAKTVDLYASYYQMSNGRSGSYALFPPVAPVAPGSTTRAFGIGMQYLFDFTTSLPDNGYGDEPPAPTPEEADVSRPEPAAGPQEAEPEASEFQEAEPPPEEAEPEEVQEEPASAEDTAPDEAEELPTDAPAPQ